MKPFFLAVFLVAVASPADAQCGAYGMSPHSPGGCSVRDDYGNPAGSIRSTPSGGYVLTPERRWDPSQPNVPGMRDTNPYRTGPRF